MHDTLTGSNRRHWSHQYAHVLGLAVVAEGIETEFQEDETRVVGCDFAQGYFFAPDDRRVHRRNSSRPPRDIFGFGSGPVVSDLGSALPSTSHSWTTRVEGYLDACLLCWSEATKRGFWAP